MALGDSLHPREGRGAVSGVGVAGREELREPERLNPKALSKGDCKCIPSGPSFQGRSPGLGGGRGTRGSLHPRVTATHGRQGPGAGAECTPSVAFRTGPTAGPGRGPLAGLPCQG